MFCCYLLMFIYGWLLQMRSEGDPIDLIIVTRLYGSHVNQISQSTSTVGSLSTI